MCIDAALTEDDFETAYSYVVGRLSALSDLAQTSSSGSPSSRVVDEWSWKAALQAGKYKRTERTLRPTHLGTASGNPEIRHLDQRIDCLSTALRIAPPPTLQEILNTYRRCEEELDAAMAAEASQENAWDEAADVQAMPGGFRISPRPARRSYREGCSCKRRVCRAPACRGGASVAVRPVAGDGARRAEEFLSAL